MEVLTNVIRTPPDFFSYFTGELCIAPARVLYSQGPTDLHPTMPRH
jgi:hypothetical protein